mgnify:CR=1 FL=1
MARTKANPDMLDQSIMIKATVLAGVVFGIILIIVGSIRNYIGVAQGSVGDQVHTGINLLLCWVSVLSAIKTMNSMRKGIPHWRLLTAGFIVPLVGVVMYQLVFHLVSTFRHAKDANATGFKSVLFYMAVGMVVAGVALINLRVKNRKKVIIFEAVFIISIALLFLLLMK